MWNRRRHDRNAIDGYSFLQIGQDEGGRVLNISEGGLLFESFAPVPRNEPTRLWFSFDLRERIEALGEVGWTGEAGNVGGLKFLELTERAREQVRARTNGTTGDEIANRKDNVSSETATGSSIELAVETEAEATPAGREPFAESILLQSSDGDMKLEALGEAGSASFYAALLIPFERFHRARRRHFVLGSLLGSVASLAVGICGFQSVRAGRHSVDVRATAPPTAPTMLLHRSRYRARHPHRSRRNVR